jgi:hypothetical protein
MDSLSEYVTKHIQYIGSRNDIDHECRQCYPCDVEPLHKNVVEENIANEVNYAAPHQNMICFQCGNEPNK